MPYNTHLADRVRALLLPLDGYSELKMFGGICFMLRGHMACAIVHDLLIVRVGPRKYAEALHLPHARVFDFTGRPMTGWVQIETTGTAEDNALATWVQRGIDFTLTLPSKKPKAGKLTGRKPFQKGFK
jgi:TfoX/Sxy family transcriptional regulator of competence genes